jgi:tetratricopeptide (TPR) repeat protein
VTRFRTLIGGRSRHEGNCDAVFQIAREVVERRRSMQGALNEVRHPALLDSLSDVDFEILDEAIVESAPEYREYALVLARLTHAAARAKGYDREIVDAALRLDSLLPLDDQSRERDQLLRDAYEIAHRAGYARGGRAALSRLGERALEADEFDRARVILQQQLDIGDDSTDTAGEVDSAIMLGDILRREGDLAGAQSHYRRASRSAARLEHYRGVAEALNRQIDLLDAGADLDTVIALQRQALDAGMHTSDLGLQSRLVLSLAESLARAGRIDDVIDQLEDGVEIARQIGDLTIESRCLHALVEAYKQRGDMPGVATYQNELLVLEERLGNRPAAARWGIRLGTTLIGLNKPQRAAEAFARAHQIARALNDPAMEQRALGGLGVAYTSLNRSADALENLMQALEISRQMGDLPQEAEWLASIGQALWTFKEPSDAIGALNESLAIARRIDDMELQASLLTLLGEIFVETGQLPRARECYHRALDLSRKLGKRHQQIELLSSLGGIASQARQQAQALALYDQALQLATETGDRAAAARLQGRLGKLAQRQRDWPQAINHYRKALELAEDLEQPKLMSQVLLHLAGAQHAVGEPAAVNSYRRALSYTQQIGDLHREALIRLNLGMLLTSDGHREDGLDHLYQAADLVADMGPLGADLADRIDEAIVRAGGELAPPPSQPPPQNGATRFGDRYDDDDLRYSGSYRDDELFSEATLPPR